MIEILKKLEKEKLISPPPFLISNLQYAAICGSEAYGCATDTSDKDIMGITIPPKEYLFPYLNGYIKGFGTGPPNFDEWQEHHVKVPDKKQTYDFKIYSLVRYFHLCLQGNPNTISVLYTPRNCVLHSTKMSEFLREHRSMFLGKHMWPSYKGYAYGQLSKLRKFSPKGKRAKLIEEHGYDTKHAYHVVRLLNEIEQILTKETIDLQENREQLKFIKKGGWSYERLEEFFDEKERQLEKLLHESTLRNKPDEEEIKWLLVDCLEMHYGRLNKELGL